MANATATRGLRIEVSKDGLHAHLQIGRTPSDEVTLDLLLELLKKSNIAITPEVEDRLREVLKLAKIDELPKEPILLAEGKEPVPGEGAMFELTAESEFSDDSAEEDDRTNFYRSQIVTVDENDIIGIYTPETPAIAGIDVTGSKIPATRPMRNLKLGNNVTLEEDGKTVRAKLAGKVHLNTSLVDVLPVLDISGDVDFSTGNVAAPNDVLIKGTVRETFEVKAKKSITVRKAIEAAHVTAGGDIQVNGGVAGQNHGKVIAGGEIFTKFCSAADLSADGTITITKQALNSRLHTKGYLDAERGSIIGGYAFGHCGAVVKIVGSEAEIKTVIAVGIDPDDLAKTREIEQANVKKREAIQKIRSTVAPLMAQMKRLTPQQRERATELMFQADEMDMQVSDQENEIKQLLALPEDIREVGVEIIKELHAGTRIIIGNKMAKFTQERRGHFKVCRRVVNRVDEIVVIDLLTASITPQHSFEFEPTRDLPEHLTKPEEKSETDESAEDAPKTA